MTEQRSDMSLSIIVCTANRHDVLPVALASLLEQDLNPSRFEIIVVDNSADPLHARECSRRYAGESRIDYVVEPCQGLANARMAGVARARAERVAFIDDDARAEPAWAEQLLHAFDTVGDQAGAVGGPVAADWGAPRPAWLGDSLLSYLSLLDRGEVLRALEPKEFLVGCNIAFDKQALLSAGGFNRDLGRRSDSGILLSNEDTELVRKIAASGKKIIYAPRAAVVHRISEDRLRREWFRSRVCWQAVSDYLSDPQSARNKAAKARRKMRERLRHGGTNVMAELYGDADDASVFAESLKLLYGITIVNLDGGFGDDHFARPGAAGGQADRNRRRGRRPLAIIQRLRRRSHKDDG